MMRLQDILFSQGFGTRRICLGLVQKGHVAIGDPPEPCTDPDRLLPPEGLRFVVDGQAWAFHERAYVLMHKPTGYECSRKPSAHPSVHTLLPAPLRERGGGAAAGVQAVGRLDQDTSGLLLLSDDGKFIHRLTSPRHHVPKVYEVGLKHAGDQGMVERLLSGVVLDDDPQPVRAEGCELVAAQHLRLTLTEGKYHQVKRMVAAVGNRVDTLHRSRIGSLTLSDDLKPGQWRWLDPAEVDALTKKTAP